MRKDREQAIKLRLAGYSYKQIKTELGVPLATLSGWFKNRDWSREIKAQLASQASLANPETLKSMIRGNSERWKTKREEYRQAAIREFERMKDDPLFLAGVMLYWGEGEKQPKSSKVRLGNSEPEMIKIFYLFLTKRLNISPDKISVWLLLYPDLVEPVMKNLWSKAAGIPIDQFRKATFIKGRQPTKRLSYGVCTIVVSSRALKERMLKWLELYGDFLKTQATKEPLKNRSPEV